jgi:hypothetical protein
VAWKTFDDLEGPELNADLWEPLTIGPSVRTEEAATTTVSDGTLTIDIPEFTNADSESQMLDNTKHVFFSARPFELAPGSVARFATELAVEQVGDGSHDYRMGFASFNVADVSGDSHMVFDLIGTRDNVLAEHEVLPFPGEENPFTRVVDSPFFNSSEGQFRRYCIELDKKGGRVTWLVDDEVLHEAAGLERLPDSVHIGFGFFTLVPVAAGQGSCHGQGGRASWRNFRYELTG